MAEARLTLKRQTMVLNASLSSSERSKIKFDLGELNGEGLRGPPGGLRSLHYEYCIPDQPDAIEQVTGIDPTLETHKGSRGRVGCGDGWILCLGNTHQPEHHRVLDLLAGLIFVTEIREAVFE